MAISSNLGYRYYVCFVDDCPLYTWMYPIKQKYEVHNIFCAFQKKVENLFDQCIKIFQSDGGREFDNEPLKLHFKNCDILFRKSCPHTPTQNGVAERKHRHIIEMARTFLIQAQLPGQFWVNATYGATYVINRLPTPLLDHSTRTTPFECLFQKKPDYSFLKVFRCECFPTLLTHLKHLNISQNGVFLLAMLLITKGISVLTTLRVKFM